MRPRRVTGSVVGSELGSSPQRCSQPQAWPQSTPTRANIQKQLLRRFDVDVDAKEAVVAAVVGAVVVVSVVVSVVVVAGSNAAAFYVFLWHLGTRDFLTRKHVRNSMGDGTFCRLSSELELDEHDGWLCSARALLHLLPDPSISRAWR